MGGSESECLSSTAEGGEPKPMGATGGKEGIGIMELLEGKMEGTPSPQNVSTKLQRVARLAKEAPEMAFTSLSHHIDMEFLREAYRRTRKKGAVGVDGLTANEYAEKLDENLALLLTRFKSGKYKAPPVKRVHIPKAGGKKTRPIGIPGFEDKVLQRATVMMLEAIYEQDFLDCSYGFRPGRSALKAVEALRDKMMDMGGGWVLEVDIQDFFGSLGHSQLRQFLDRRVRDGVIRRTIDKWLAAGVMEKGQIIHPDTGSPQGGVVSPIVANVYLHEVMDKWFADTVKPRLQSEAFLVRYCDDIVIVFRNEEDARKVMEVLPKRFGKYGLTLHPEKTKLVAFKRPYRTNTKKGMGTESDTFDFLGFQHYWGRSRRGYWVIKRKTGSERLTRAVQAIYQWCKENRHERVGDQSAMLSLKLRGHYGYYGITGNFKALVDYHRAVLRAWFKWLNRRSQKHHLTWQQMYTTLLPRLPKPIVVHSVSAARP